MANPTTNYGWPMPTSTDLVTDLPADFAAFGQPVDTSLKALNPETTLGDIAYRSATANTNTRLGIGTNGQVLAVSGGVPAWTTTADVTPLTTKGDLFTFDTADARLGVGTNGQTLVADSSTATGLKWDTVSSGLSAATQAEMEAASSTTVAVTPGRQQYHPSAAKFWVKFNGTGTPAINASYNFTSITDNGTGYYTLNIGTDFSSGSYCVVASSAKLSGASSSATIMMASPLGAFNAGDFGLITSNLDGTLSDSDANFVTGYGDQ